MKNSSYSSVVKVLQILDVFSQLEKPIGVSELANLTNLNVSTVSRIAQVLANHGYLRNEGKRGRYSVGLKFLKFNNVLQNTLQIKDVALPYMEKLQVISGESVNLVVLDKDEAVYINHLESNQMLRTFTALGSRVPLYCTGVGKIFLAYMNEDDAQLHLKRPFVKYTKNTITQYSVLKKELIKIKQEGVALDNGEMDIDVRCVSAPIFGADGSVIASVSVSGSQSRLPADRIEELKPLVIRYAFDISKAMGYDI